MPEKENVGTTTCIVGLVHSSKVYIGGDSAGVNSWLLAIRKRFDPKVFKNGEMIFGFTTSFRMGQILRYSLTPPKPMEGQDDYEYLCTTFINEVRKCLGTEGFKKTKDGVEYGGTFLLGYRGRLYQIESDFQVGRILNNYDACGCGEEYALGALKAMESIVPREPWKIVVKALQAAEEFSAGVSAPFKVICSDGEERMYATDGEIITEKGG